MKVIVVIFLCSLWFLVKYLICQICFSCVSALVVLYIPLIMYKVKYFRYKNNLLFFMFVSGHCHRSRNEEIDKRARRKLIIASILCVVFMIGEIVGE